MAKRRVHKLDVGIRELRANLSRYVDEVRAGREITITDHGHPVARLMPPAGESVLDRLIREGIVTPPSKPAARVSKPRIKLSGKGSIADLVAEQRR